jgi:hypothetical protein
VLIITGSSIYKAKISITYYTNLVDIIHIREFYYADHQSIAENILSVITVDTGYRFNFNVNYSHIVI